MTSTRSIPTGEALIQCESAVKGLEGEQEHGGHAEKGGLERMDQREREKEKGRARREIQAVSLLVFVGASSRDKRRFSAEALHLYLSLCSFAYPPKP